MIVARRLVRGRALGTIAAANQLLRARHPALLHAPSHPALLRRCSFGSDAAAAGRRRLTTAAGPETPEAAIRRLHTVMLDAADSTHETFVPTVASDGILTVDLGDKGQYSFQEHNGQLMLFSPVSGPCCYTYDGGNRWWTDPNDGHLLDEKLVREMMHITSVYLNL